MRRCGRAVAATVVAAALITAAAGCAGDPVAGGARAPGTTGTSRPKPAVPTPVGEDPLPHPLEDRLQRVLDATRPTLPGTPGLIASVWVPGVGAWASISVEADPKTTEPLATNDHVRIGRVTTSMTVALVLQLVDQGQLGLDDPVSTWFPEIPGSAQMTVRQLATMQSGIDDTVNSVAVQQTRAADRTHVFTPEELTAVEQQPAAPGTGMAMADTNTVLLGRIVEKVTGKPYRTVLQDQLLGPLGMHQTAVPESADASIPRPFTRGFTATTPGAGSPGSTPGTTPDAAAGSTVDPPGGLPVPATVDATGWNPSWLSYAGAATSTVRDLSIWGYHLGSGALLKPATFEAQRRFASAPGSTAPPYGMGLMSFAPAQLPALPWIGFEGSIDGYSTIVAFDPATSAVIVVIATSDVRVPDADPEKRRQGVTHTPTMLTFDALRDVLRSDPPPTTVVTAPAAGTTAPGTTAPALAARLTSPPDQVAGAARPSPGAGR